jgi:hypothetical protein
MRPFIGPCRKYDGSRGVYRFLMGKPEGRRPLRRPRSRWEENIKIYLEKVGCASVDWIELAQDRDK